jgi:hypothetical protein
VSDAVASTTYEIPISQIEYISLGAGVVLDTAGRVKLLSDATIVTDGVAKSFAKGLTDAAMATASQPSLEPRKGLSDSIALADELTRTLVFLRNFADAATVAETSSFQFTRGVDREFLLVDDTQTLGFTKVITDGFAMNDSADVGDGSTYSFSKGISNITFATDTSTRSMSKGLTDSAATADGAPVFGVAKGLFDTVSPAEVQFFVTTKVLLDAIAVPDAPALSVSRPLTDGASVGDNSFLQFAATRVESTVVADEGFLFAQNYCDLTYFASDYVGVSQSF